MLVVKGLLLLYVYPPSGGAGFCPIGFLWFYKGVFQTPWIFSCAGFSAVSNFDSLKGSALGGSFDVFCPSELLVFYRPNSSEVSALVAGFFSLSTCPVVLSGS